MCRYTFTRISGKISIQLTLTRKTSVGNRIHWTVIIFVLSKSFSLSNFQADEADDYEIICRDGSFGIHEHCLFSSEFLYKQHRARKNFEGEGKETRLTMLFLLLQKKTFSFKSLWKKIENSIWVFFENNLWKLHLMLCTVFLIKILLNMNWLN